MTPPAVDMMPAQRIPAELARTVDAEVEDRTMATWGATRWATSEATSIAAMVTAGLADRQKDGTER